MTQSAQLSEQVKHPRGVERLVTGKATSGGVGVQLTRMLTQNLQRRLDPFLMMDIFDNTDPDHPIAGFPDHPHRGFEIITYMIAGRMLHRDSSGHEGVLENGGVQWMTAGRGIIHSEIPKQEEGVMEGCQLWLNLPACDKMSQPCCRDFKAEELPRLVTDAGVTVTVIAGQSRGVTGVVTRDATAPLYLDLHLPAGACFAQAVLAQHNVFLYVYRGEMEVGGTSVSSRRMAILSNEVSSDGVIIEAKTASKALLIAGRPLKEPIEQYGPFAMNTKDEIYQALGDFRDGRLA